jgi:hypothetical protein
MVFGRHPRCDCQRRVRLLTDSSYSLVGDDRVDRGVETGPQHEQTEEEDEDVEDSEEGLARAGEQVALVEVIVCDGPEDEAEE